MDDGEENSIFYVITYEHFQTGEDPFTLYFAGTFIVDTVFFWPFASIFSYFDIVGGPHILQRFLSSICLSQETGWTAF